MESVTSGILQAIEQSSFDMMITDFDKTFYTVRQDALAEVNLLFLKFNFIICQHHYFEIQNQSFLPTKLVAFPDEIG